MASVYPFDEFTRQRVAQALYALVPLFYRVQDQPPQGNQELQKVLRVLAAPLATLRQSIDETHANFFIDSCGDAALPLLAQIIGTTLVFPDADTNRRDLRGTISRRERKGTRPMLEELGRDLTEQLTVLIEGWQRLIISQDLNLQRLDRTLADVRPSTFGSSAAGPLDAAQHLVDIRTISNTMGRYHPRDITHWVHITRTFPFKDATPRYLPALPGDPDPLAPTDVEREWRYAFQSLGLPWALRQRPSSDDDHINTDRILADHFAARPADFFDVEGRFAIRIAGLPAAVAASNFEARDASIVPANLAIARGNEVTIELLNRPLNGWESGRFELTVGVAGRDSFNPNMPNTNSFEARATLVLGTATLVHVPAVTIDSAQLVLLRLATVDGTGGYFPGATVVITGGLSSAARAHPDGTLASLGFLRGALAVTLPATWVLGAPQAVRWLYLAADGSVFDAQSSGQGAGDIPLIDNSGVLELDPLHLSTVGPGAAWPPLPREGSPSRLTLVTPPPGRGPIVLHGGTVLLNNDNDEQAVPVAAGTQCALVFAFRHFDAGTTHKLIGRLSWVGPNPKDARWQVFADDHDITVVTDAATILTRLTALVGFRNDGPNQLALAIRFECAVDAIFTPSEVAWSSDDGETTLLYLVEMATTGPAVTSWPSLSGYHVSDIVEAHEDGSTLSVTTTQRRLAEGQVAPLRGSTLHLRRRAKWKSLEASPAPPDLAALRMAERCLTVDVELGQFALYGEAPQPWPLGPIDPEPPNFVRPPNVTVAFEDASTANVGAHPTAREMLVSQLEPQSSAPIIPTRIVSRSGTLKTSRDPDVYVFDVNNNPRPVPLYTSLKDALSAIAVAHAPVEVVQIQDDSTYPDETLIWPNGVDSLTIVSADSRRPVLLLTPPDSPPSATYTALTLRGIAFGGAPVMFPMCSQIDIQFCTITDVEAVFTIPFPANGVCNILRSVTAGLVLLGTGTLNVTDSIIDAGTESPAIGADPLHLIETDVTCERSTIIGTTDALVLNASKCIFGQHVGVTDRFHGCVRYSSVPEGSVLPLRHQVVQGLDFKFLSLDRNHPNHVRLSDETPHAIRAGGEDGSELGAFNHLKSTQRLEAFEGRLRESTPASLVWALLRVN